MTQVVRNATLLIDTVDRELLDTERALRKIPQGSYITNEGPYYEDYLDWSKAKHAINAISCAVGINEEALIRAARIVRKWYERGDGQSLLPEKTAQHLITYLDSQYC
jgi:hypothetical protein